MVLYALTLTFMTDRLGPIVRVNPYELSIGDASFYDTVYVSGGIRPTKEFNYFVRGPDLGSASSSLVVNLTLTDQIPFSRPRTINYIGSGVSPWNHTFRVLG